MTDDYACECCGADWDSCPPCEQCGQDCTTCLIHAGPPDTELCADCAGIEPITADDLHALAADMRAAGGSFQAMTMTADGGGGVTKL